MKLYLGTHQPSWLATVELPLFVSHRRLAHRRSLPRARVGWALDSGGFTELSLHGHWQTTPAAYIAAVRRYRDQIGRLEWAAPQDWMCEPDMLTRTGRTVADHQRLTVTNYLTLQDLAPELPFAPVLQGWELADYLRCAELYQRAGIDLTAVLLVGVGSVCRRQHTHPIAAVTGALAAVGLRLHGFGVKTRGLALYADHLTSADSLAWSYRARRAATDGHRTPGCRHTSCANCPTYATAWHHRLTTRLAHQQLALDLWTNPHGDDQEAA